MSMLMSCNGGEVGPIDLTESLVSHYLLNNNADDSFGDNDGTAVSGVDFQGDKVYLDGTKHITTPTFSTLSQTASFWFMQRSKGTEWQSLLHWGGASSTDGNTAVIGIDNISGTLFTHTDNGGDVYGSTPILNNTLYHVVFTSQGKLYLNGNLEATNVAPTLTVATESFAIGADWDGGTLYNNFFDGEVSNLRMYDEIKSQPFITALHEEGYYPKPLPLPTTDRLIAHYPFTGTEEDAHGEGGNESGTEYNGVTFIDDVTRGSVSSYDGVNDFIHIGENVPSLETTTYSVNVWAKRQSDDVMCVFNNNAYEAAPPNALNGGSWLYIAGSGVPVFRFAVENSETFTTDQGSTRTSSTIFIVGTAIPQDTWVNIGVVLENGNSSKMYINGVLTESVTSVQTMSYSNTNTHYSIGARVASLPATMYYPFNGQISTMKHYNRVLTAEEMLSLANEEPISTDGLVADFPLTKEWRALDGWASYDGVGTNITYVDDDQYGSVIDFNGGTAYIDLDNITTGEFTITMWVNPDTATNGKIVSCSNISNKGFVIGITPTGNLILEYWNPIQKTTATYIFNLNEWNFVAVRYVAGEIRMQLNENSYIVNDTIVHDSTSNMRIGRANWSIQYEYNGQLRNLRFYGKGIATQEITDIYNYEKNFRPIDIDDGLVAYYPLASNSLDNYYNEYDGTDTSMTYDGLSGVFNGTSSNVTLPILGITTGVCFSTWINPEIINVHHRVIGYTGTTVESNMFILLVDADNTIRFLTKVDSIDKTAISTTLATSNTWIHAVGLVNVGKSIDIYINGVLENSVSVGTNFTVVDLTGTPQWVVGAGRSGTNNYFSGKISKVRAYKNKIITAEQVAEIYNSEKGEFGL